jgi:crossover junction endodeoxyribonuclease RuvC
MESFGVIKGICAATYKPISIVPAAKWKRVMLAGKGADKGASIVRAKELYPHVQLNRKKDHHKAESILLAWYGLRHVLSINLSSTVLDFARSN